MTNVQNMCDQILCPKGTTYEFHKLKCIQGDYSACGISTLQVCPFEVDVNNVTTISWHQFEKVLVGRLIDGKDRHGLHLEYPSRKIVFCNLSYATKKCRMQLFWSCMQHVQLQNSCMRHFLIT